MYLHMLCECGDPAGHCNGGHFIIASPTKYQLFGFLSKPSSSQTIEKEVDAMVKISHCVHDCLQYTHHLFVNTIITYTEEMKTSDNTKEYIILLNLVVRYSNCHG